MEKVTVDEIKKIELMIESLEAKLVKEANSLTKEGLEIADRLVDNTIASLNKIGEKLESELVMAEEDIAKIDERCNEIIVDVVKKIDELPHIEIAEYKTLDNDYMNDVKAFVNVAVQKGKEIYKSEECQKLISETKDGVLKTADKALDALKEILEKK
ncbi:MAG: hypothetical protein ACI4WM_01935 [Erysipelotrichaceae bacterium]